jgi:para-nitrobenzyl esterase
VRDASKLGYASPQNKGIIAMVEETNEDCLYLNVVTPAVDEKKRPVMFWIHGGSFTSGSGEQSVYLSSPIPKVADVVLVTINYRLGVLGFVNFNGLSDNTSSSSNSSSAFSSNNGLRDMLAALEWVQENIENFGGDPDNVTIFGESAGAMGVSSLLGSPKAKGLFHKAIAQSGAAHMTSLPEDGVSVAKAFINEAGIGLDNLNELKRIELEKILKIQEKISSIKFSNENREHRLPLSSFAFIPTIGDDVLPEDPLIAIEKGLAKDIPVLIGTNLHEWSFFVQLSDPGKNTLDKEALYKVIKSRVPGHETEVVDCYFEHEDAKPVDVFSAIESDRFFRIPAIRLLEAQMQHQQNCYSYLFTYEASLLDGKLGSCHAVELPFIFGTVEDNFAKLFVGENPKIKTLSDKCVDAWTHFAKTGSPQCESLGIWTAYEHENRNFGKGFCRFSVLKTQNISEPI